MTAARFPARDLAREGGTGMRRVGYVALAVFALGLAVAGQRLRHSGAQAGPVLLVGLEVAAGIGLLLGVLVGCGLALRRLAGVERPQPPRPPGSGPGKRSQLAARHAAAERAEAGQTLAGVQPAARFSLSQQLGERHPGERNGRAPE